MKSLNKTWQIIEKWSDVKVAVATILILFGSKYSMGTYASAVDYTRNKK